MTQAMPGDVLLRVFTTASFQLVDAVTGVPSAATL